MESKKVKIVDEHNIDREASIICPFTVDQNDYVLYSIERDQDNSNLFVSKLLKNNDNTSNMMNIEDSMERTKINEIVKKLVTYALDNGSDVANREIVLDGGVKININNVLFNREQNINVSKTYITTVKRSVALVGEKFFNLPEEKPANVVPDSIFTDIPAPAVEPAPAVMPEPVPTPVPEPVPEPSPAPAPIFEVNNSTAAPAVTPEPTLVFDAKNETNLNNALNAENNDKAVVTSDVDALRSFGTDGNQTTEPQGNGSKGFINFKVIAIIGLIVFMAACAFMGYEIYHYIQIVNK